MSAKRTRYTTSLQIGSAFPTARFRYFIRSGQRAGPVRDICAFSGLTKQTVNSALRKLEAEGSVTTESSGARHKTVTLTPKGAELAEKTVAKVIEIENEILGSWPAEDLEKYIRLTEEFLVSMRARAQEVHS